MTISEEQALERARAAAEERGWSWAEPVHVNRQRRYVFFGRRSYEILTNAAYRGNNLRFEIDAEDGSVIGAYRLPR